MVEQPTRSLSGCLSGDCRADRHRHSDEILQQRVQFGRSKTGSGAFHFKRNWGFEPQPLAYASWTADGVAPRDADPTSPRYQAKIAAWRKLPLGIANRIGPLIARGLA